MADVAFNAFHQHPPEAVGGAKFILYKDLSNMCHSISKRESGIIGSSWRKKVKILEIILELLQVVLYI